MKILHLLRWFVRERTTRQAYQYRI